MYSQMVLDHFKNPRNVGAIENADGVGEVGNPVCGDMMTFYIKVKDNVIEDVKFQTFGESHNVTGIDEIFPRDVHFVDTTVTVEPEIAPTAAADKKEPFPREETFDQTLPLGRHLDAHTRSDKGRALQ